MGPIIEVKNLFYCYPNGDLALENVSMQVFGGEVVAILGPNGAGKSTLLLNLAKVLEGEGVIELSGESLKKKKRTELVREIGVVFQYPDDQLFMPTVFDDVSFGPLSMGLTESEVNSRVREALDAVGLNGFETRLSHSLSFGEKKKVALATVLSMKPNILLLDEPTSNLDLRSRREIIDVINKLKKEGRTIILSTHDVSVVSEVVDRIYILNKRIVAEGTPRQIFMDSRLLKETNLEVPAVTYLFELLCCFGYDCKNLPLSIEEATEHLTKTIETAGGHIHLHIHEHTHTQIKELKEKHSHH